MRFYLGTHHASQRWWDLGVPLFISRRTLAKRRSLPTATETWALDSGGFTELSMLGEWRTPPEQYVAEIERFGEIGRLEWAAPQDWMCEPFVLGKTGLTVEEHQRRTVENFLRLRDALGHIVIPVVQGWAVDDYQRCWDRYHRAGVDLEWERVVGVGSVCRRQNTAEAGRILRTLAANVLGEQLHAFGVKIAGLASFGDVLASADSMAWSYRARRDFPLPGCTHKSCANCPRYAVRWYGRVINGLAQQRLEVAA